MLGARELVRLRCPVTALAGVFVQQHTAELHIAGQGTLRQLQRPQMRAHTHTYTQTQQRGKGRTAAGERACVVRCMRACGSGGLAAHNSLLCVWARWSPGACGVSLLPPAPGRTQRLRMTASLSYSHDPTCTQAGMHVCRSACTDEQAHAG